MSGDWSSELHMRKTWLPQINTQFLTSGIGAGSVSGDWSTELHMLKTWLP